MSHEKNGFFSCATAVKQPMIFVVSSRDRWKVGMRTFSQKRNG